MTTAATAGPVVGAQAPPKEYGPMTRQMFVRYSGASGDLNPMHYDDEMARGAGYPSVFSQGMHVAALLAGYAAEWLGAENVRRFGIRFRTQVFPGDVLTCTGRVTAVSDTDEGRLVTVELEAAVGDKPAAVSGSADFLLPS
jgi:acyl dehydratase